MAPICNSLTMPIRHLKVFAHSRNGHLTQALCQLGEVHGATATPPWRATKVTTVDPTDVGNPDVVYVVSFPQRILDWATWPAVQRILYQVEQFPHTPMYRQEWFWRPFVSPHVVSIWDYTQANLPHYPPTLRPKVHIKPFPCVEPGPLTPLPLPKEGPIDVLFYGYGNHRRNQLMNALMMYLVPRGVSVRYLQGVYGDALQPHIRYAKVVLNLHFFDAGTSYLETYRLNELLAHRVAIVSELPSDADKRTVPIYRRAGVEFVPAVRTTMDMLRLAVVIECFIREPWRRALATNMNHTLMDSVKKHFISGVG